MCRYRCDATPTSKWCVERGQADTSDRYAVLLLPWAPLFLCMYIYIYIYIYICICIHTVYIYIYVWFVVCVCVVIVYVYLYVYIYIYIYRERERDSWVCYLLFIPSAPLLRSSTFTATTLLVSSPCVWSTQERAFDDRVFDYIWYMQLNLICRNIILSGHMPCRQKKICV